MKHIEYFVHVILKATDDNPSFAGKEEEWYAGRDGKTVLGETYRKYGRIILDGWRRKHFAERYIKKDTEYYNTKAKYWNIKKIEIVTDEREEW